MLWHARDEERRPGFFYDLDETGGFKHGLSINFADKRMNKINKILKDKTGMGWKEYLLSEIDRNPVLADTEDAFIYEWSGVAVYLWTRKDEEIPILLTEASKAIRKLVGESGVQLDGEMQTALDEGDAERYVELFVELSGEGGKKEIELALTSAKPLLESGLDPDLLAAMAAATIKTGTKPLQAMAKELGLAKRIAAEDGDFHDGFIMSLQRSYQDVMYAGDEWKASKGLVKRYYDNIGEVMGIYGYEAKKMAIMTIIFLFYNDVVEGIGFDAYMADEDYRDDEWPYTDTDLTFWKKFDPDTVTGLKTGKGGYAPDGEDDDCDEDEGGFEKRLEYDDGASHKFWSIKLEGDVFTVRFGKTGTEGQLQTKEFASGEIARKEALKLYNAKIKKGYEEV